MRNVINAFQISPFSFFAAKEDGEPVGFLCLKELEIAEKLLTVFFLVGVIKT